MARLQYDVNRARSFEELAQVMLNGGASAKEILDMERAAKRREVLQNLINEDPGISRVREKVTINVSNELGTEVVVNDPANVLSEHTVKMCIRDSPSSYRHQSISGGLRFAEWGGLGCSIDQCYVGSGRWSICLLYTSRCV